MMSYTPTNKPNTYMHPHYGLCVFREGQTPDEFEREMTAIRPEKVEAVRDAEARRLAEQQRAGGGHL